MKELMTKTNLASCQIYMVEHFSEIRIFSRELHQLTSFYMMATLVFNQLTPGSTACVFAIL